MAMAGKATPVPSGKPGAVKLDPLHAVKALGRLLADKDDTAQVFEIMRALNGKTSAQNYRRLLSTREGGRIAYERVEFGRLFSDDAWMSRMPAGSVGAAYREFVGSEDLSTAWLAQVSRQTLSHIDEPHPHAWFGRRTRDSHDLWHVLAGYGRDALGEACLVAFSYAQTGGPGWALIALGAAHRFRGSGQPYKRAVWEGYRRGRAAKWLLAEDYERLLGEPLEAARQRLGLAPPRLYDSIPAVLRNPATAR